MHSPVAILHTFTVSSYDPEITCCPSGVTATEWTVLVWEDNILTSFLVVMSHIFTVLLAEPDTIVVALTNERERTEPLCPFITPICTPISAFHAMMEQSFDPEKIRFVFFSYKMERTKSL